MNEDLFSVTNTGEPKMIVQDFLQEVVISLKWLTDRSRLPSFPTSETTTTTSSSSSMSNDSQEVKAVDTKESTNNNDQKNNNDTTKQDGDHNVSYMTMLENWFRFYCIVVRVSHLLFRIGHFSLFYTGTVL